MLYPVELQAYMLHILADFSKSVKVEAVEILGGGNYHLSIPKRSFFWYDRKKNGRNLYAELYPLHPHGGVFWP